jgi:hypothetical protein
MAVIAALHGHPPEQVRWSDLLTADLLRPGAPRTRETANAWVRTVVNRWLLLGDVRPELSDPLGPASLRLSTKTFGALAVQLSLVATRAQGLALCSACAAPFLRQGRQPKPGQRTYCERCRIGGAGNRLRQTDFRRRRSQEDRQDGA